MPSTPLPVRLAELADAAPSAPAVTVDGHTVTRSELERSTNRLARVFADRGVRPGSLVSIGLENSIRHVECTVAAWKLGAVPQPVSHRLPQHELDAVLAVADPALVVGLKPGDGRAWLPADHDTAGVDDSPLPLVVGPSWKAPTSGGSTGRPKVIVSGAEASVEAVLPRAEALRIEPDGVFLSTAPLYHNAPFMFSLIGLLQGNHLVLMRRFAAADTLDLVAAHRATWLYVVPTMMSRILKLPADVRAAADLSSLRTVFHVGAPCPPHVKRAWLEWVPPEVVLELYAGTESQASTLLDGREWLAHPGSVGRVLAGEMIVTDEAGRELPPGEIGEIWMRTSDGTPSYHYLGAEARARDGWESLGDLGSFDADGYLYLADRRTDMILVGGGNVYPAEVEAALDAHPMALGSAVIGLPDDDLGNTVHAIVHIGPDTDPAAAEAALREHLAAHLAPYKTPRTYEFTHTQLRDDAGKVRRTALRAARLGG